MLNFMKIHPMGAALFHADGRTDGETVDSYGKFIVGFRNFAEAPNNVSLRSGVGRYELD